MTTNNDAVAVIFDMDGVLVDTYRPHFLSWREAAEHEGRSLTEAQFAPTFGRTGEESAAMFWEESQCGPEEVARILAYKETAFRRIMETDFPAMTGIRELLHALHDAGFRLAVGSSGPSENVQLVVDLLGTRSLFGAVISGDDVSHGKPDPEVFLLAAGRLGASPARCAVIEDSPVGIAAANAAGMMPIGLMSTGRTPENFAAAEMFVRSLDELTPGLLRAKIEQRARRRAGTPQ
jgi:beta-phosphoglucomutase